MHQYFIINAAGLVLLYQFLDGIITFKSIRFSVYSTATLLLSAGLIFLLMQRAA